MQAYYLLKEIMFSTYLIIVQNHNINGLQNIVCKKVKVKYNRNSYKHFLHLCRQNMLVL